MADAGADRGPGSGSGETVKVSKEFAEAFASLASAAGWDADSIAEARIGCRRGILAYGEPEVLGSLLVIRADLEKGIIRGDK